MDTKLKYQEIIKSILTETAEYRASIPDGYNSQVLFDDEHERYLVLDIGWNDDQYLHTTPIHVDLIDQKIWIQYDDTEEGIANDFLAAGVHIFQVHIDGLKYCQFRLLPEAGYLSTTKLTSNRSRYRRTSTSILFNRHSTG